MSVESFLTRELDIRFIDARNIVSEAKVNLGIHGYPTKHQIDDIRDESLRDFGTRSEDSKSAMKQLKTELEAVKVPRRSLSSGLSENSSNVCLERSTSSSFLGQSTTNSSTTSSSNNTNHSFKMKKKPRSLRWLLR